MVFALAAGVSYICAALFAAFASVEDEFCKQQKRPPVACEVWVNQAPACIDKWRMYSADGLRVAAAAKDWWHQKGEEYPEQERLLADAARV